MSAETTYLETVDYVLDSIKNGCAPDKCQNENRKKCDAWIMFYQDKNLIPISHGLSCNLKDPELIRHQNKYLWDVMEKLISSFNKTLSSQEERIEIEPFKKLIDLTLEGTETTNFDGLNKIFDKEVYLRFYDYMVEINEASRKGLGSDIVNNIVISFQNCINLSLFKSFDDLDTKKQ